MSCQNAISIKTKGIHVHVNQGLITDTMHQSNFIKHVLVTSFCD